MTPCTQGCPAHTDISAYMEKLREGDVDEAARIILRANPMPAITRAGYAPISVRKNATGSSTMSVSM